MLLPLLLLAALAPDLGRLGDGDWRTREAESGRLDNPLSALLLPPRHDDPEIDRRVKEIRKKHLCWLDPVYVEKHMRATDYERWLALYVLGDRPSLFSDYEVFYELHTRPALAALYFKLAPHCELPHGNNEWGIPIWLWSTILDGEFEAFLFHRDGCRKR